jgi:hypothetical protein
MRRSWPVALQSLALISVAAAFARAAPDWREYEFPDSGFAISAPGAPTINSRSVPTPRGPLTLEEYQFNLSDGTHVEVAVALTGTVDTTEAKERLQNGKWELIKRNNGTLVAERDIVVSGVPGLEFDAETADLSLRDRGVAAHRRMYQVLAIWKRGEPISPDDVRMLESFRILPDSI